MLEAVWELRAIERALLQREPEARVLVRRGDRQAVRVRLRARERKNVRNCLLERLARDIEQAVAVRLAQGSVRRTRSGCSNTLTA